MLEQEYRLRKHMDDFEETTRKVVANMKKYSLIEFYHEEKYFKKKIKSLDESLD